jgi:hypothetical protein
MERHALSDVQWARLRPLLPPPSEDGEALLIAAGHNLKRLLSRRGWGRRPFPAGATGVVLPALLPLSVVT